MALSWIDLSPQCERKLWAPEWSTLCLWDLMYIPIKCPLMYTVFYPDDECDNRKSLSTVIILPIVGNLAGPAACKDECVWSLRTSGLITIKKCEVKRETVRTRKSVFFLAICPLKFVTPSVQPLKETFFGVGYFSLFGVHSKVKQKH